MKYKLYQGDCLTFMDNDCNAGDFDIVVTDPPYSINTKSDGQGKLNPWGDRLNAALWYREWIGRCQKLMLGRGCLWSFLNWRSLVTFQKAADDLCWPIESILIWDKCWIGPGGHKGLRPSYEMVALWAGNDFAIKDRGLADIQRFQWSSNKPSGHPAEKPLDLMKWIIEISTKPNEIVFDPFMGSGTTGIACMKLGRNFIGCEIDPNYYSLAEMRIKAEEAQLSMFPIVER